MGAQPPLEATLSWLERLVAHATIAGRSNELLIGEVATYLEVLGAAVAITPGARADALNLVASFGDVERSDGVMLCAHTDVVDVEGQPWTREPFALQLANERAYGRGCADMKGFIAVALAALEHFDPSSLRRPLWLALSSDEEIGCVGVRPLLDELSALDQRPAWALVGEPTSLRVADRHKGKAAMRIEFHGLAAHSSLPYLGANAVAYAGRLIAAVLDEQRAIAAGELDTSFAVPYTTLGIGPIQGGVAVNIVPDYCRLDLEIRTVPADDPQARVEQIAALCAELEAALGSEYPQGSVTITPLSGYPGLSANSVEGVDAEIRAVCGSAARTAVDFGTEAGLYSQRLGMPVVVCGPGSIDDAHGADESIALSQLRGCDEIIGNILGLLAE